MARIFLSSINSILIDYLIKCYLNDKNTNHRKMQLIWAIFIIDIFLCNLYLLVSHHGRYLSFYVSHHIIYAWLKKYTVRILSIVNQFYQLSMIIFRSKAVPHSLTCFCLTSLNKKTSKVETLLNTMLSVLILHALLTNFRSFIVHKVWFLICLLTA